MFSKYDSKNYHWEKLPTVLTTIGELILFLFILGTIYATLIVILSLN